jgi:hypothetical protein
MAEEKAPVKPRKTADVEAKPENPAAAPQGKTLKEQGGGVIQEIGNIITAASAEGAAFFTEDEKEEARQVIRETRLDAKGIQDLEGFKGFLSEELSKRKSKNAA